MCRICTCTSRDNTLSLVHPTYFKGVWSTFSSSSDLYFKGVGPLFFYTGNEGAIEGFYDNSGFVFELASNFNALVVFAEHVSDCLGGSDRDSCMCSLCPLGKQFMRHTARM